MPDNVEYKEELISNALDALGREHLANPEFASQVQATIGRIADKVEEVVASANEAPNRKELCSHLDALSDTAQNLERIIDKPGVQETIHRTWGLRDEDDYSEGVFHPRRAEEHFVPFGDHILDSAVPVGECLKY